MKRDTDFDALGKNAWEQLPPRHNSPQALAAVIGGKPVAVNAFCTQCDSNISDGVFAPYKSKNDAVELRHFSEPEIHILRPSELRILEHWARAGFP